jgi:glycosyltransferase involved in cell wall biosynthesis
MSEINKIKQILYISTNFPPIKSSESIQVYYNLKYLYLFNYFPIVISENPSLLEETDDFIKNSQISIAVYRINSIETMLKNFLYKVNKSKKNCMDYNEKKSSHENKIGTSILRKIKFLPNRKFFWTPFSVFFGLRIIRKNKIRLIFSRSGMINSHIVALILKYITGIPWIASFSDPWTTDPNDWYRNLIIPYNFAKWIDIFLERVILKNADKVIFTTSQLKEEYLKRYPKIKEDFIIVIPNSYDIKLDMNSSLKQKSDKIIITYAGSLNEKRSPKYFFEALRKLKEEYFELNNRKSVV